MKSNRPKRFPKALTSNDIDQYFEDFVAEHKEIIQDYTYALKKSDGTQRFEAWAHHPQRKNIHLTEDFYHFMINLDE